METGLRDAYDTQLRAWLPPHLPAGAVVERDGPLIRLEEPGQRGFLTYVTLDGLSGDALDALIARQVAHFTARGEGVEWKLHGHDAPADLADRLRAAGFEPEDQETVVIGPAGPLADRAPAIPDGLRMREVTARADLDRIAAMEATVWSDDRTRIAVGLEAELAADPTGTTVIVVENDDLVVCAGWVRYVGGTEFATLWGGSTLPQWRGVGIYKAVVRYRAALAVTRGHSLLEVDASDNSRPILQRLGFEAVTTTTPYVFTP